MLWDISIAPAAIALRIKTSALGTNNAIITAVPMYFPGLMQRGEIDFTLNAHTFFKEINVSPDHQFIVPADKRQ